MKRLLLFFVLFVLCGTILVAQSYSTLERFTVHRGTDVLMRTDNTRTYFVSYVTIDRYTNRFFVSYNNTVRYFDLWTPPGNVPYANNFGFVVQGMEVLGSDCYFSGSYWWETGNVIYNIDGTYYNETDTVGIIGRFNLVDVMSGSGNYEFMKIYRTHVLSRLTPTGYGAVAIGTLDDNVTPCVVEVLENSYPPVDYSYYVKKSSLSDEHFMDITICSTKVVVASRFDNTSRPDYFKKYFALRYGIFNNYFGNANKIIYYNTHMAFNSDLAYFSGVDPLLVSSTHKDNEVAVSYLTSPPWDPLRFIMIYKIDEEEMATSQLLYGGEWTSYKRLKEARFNLPLVQTTNMAMLLEDDEGNSVFRFPYMSWTCQMCNDTVLYTNEFTLQSIAPFQHMSNQLAVRAGGYYPSTNNSHVWFYQNRIHDPYGTWPDRSCMNKREGTWYRPNRVVEPEVATASLETQKIDQHSVFIVRSFESFITKPDVLCEK